MKIIRTIAGLVAAVALVASAATAHAAPLNPQPEPPGITTAR